MKQTAVEWLFDNLDLTGGSEAIETLKKAKEMEKEQITESYKHGQNNGYMFKDGNALMINAGKYYNETFKSE